MTIDTIIHVLSNIIIFTVCTWAVLSNKIHDGLIIKLGLTLMAFASLADLSMTTITPAGLVMDMGASVICMGVFLRVEVYPRYFKNITYLCNICSAVPFTNKKRRQSDYSIAKGNDANSGTT
jgi:hypothetical protein